VVFTQQRLSRAQTMRLNPKQWAYVGDAVYDLFVRTHVMTTTDYPLPRMHRMSVARVGCKPQAAALARIEPFLNEEEADIVRRGRKLRTHTTHPNADQGDYARATALEALIGYLYLTGQDDRLEQIMQIILQEENHGTQVAEC